LVVFSAARNKAVARIGTGVVGHLDPPSLAPGRFVEHEFTLFLREQNGEAQVVGLAAVRKISDPARDAVEEVPQPLGPEVGVLAVEVS
jgi:hypothetical protein